MEEAHSRPPGPDPLSSAEVAGLVIQDSGSIDRAQLMRVSFCVVLLLAFNFSHDRAGLSPLILW